MIFQNGRIPNRGTLYAKRSIPLHFYSVFAFLDILYDLTDPHWHRCCRVLHLDRRILREIRYRVIRAPKGIGIYCIDMAFGDMR